MCTSFRVLPYLCAVGVLPNIGTARGIITPYARGLIIKDIEFINFDGNNVCYGGTQIDGHTQDHNGGYIYHVATHSFTNSPNIIGFRWLHLSVRPHGHRASAAPVCRVG